MSFTANGDDLAVRTFLPVNEQNQIINDEYISSESLDFRKEITTLFTRGDWTQYQAQGTFTINYSFNARIRAMKYNIAPDIIIPASYGDTINRFLESTDVIQVNDPFISNLTKELKAERMIPMHYDTFAEAYDTLGEAEKLMKQEMLKNDLTNEDVIIFNIGEQKIIIK